MKGCTVKLFSFLLFLSIYLFFNNMTTVFAEEDTDTIDTSQNPVVTLEPIAQTIIMRKDLKTATLPIYVTTKATISSIRTNDSNFKAEYDNGVIIISAFNTQDYSEHSDVFLTLYLEGMNEILQPYSEELQIMVEIESKESITEELNKIKPLDVSTMTAYNRTLYLNALDKRRIACNEETFADCKITCIGDSITEGVGLLEGEQSRYSYPADLQHILKTEEVLNLGKGGTSISSYWDSFLSITEGISTDTDIILVMGGVNDCYSGNKDNMGSLESCEIGTFYGDTNFLMQDLKERYPDSRILFITPFPTVTTTSYLSFLPDMLPLSVYAESIKELGEKNDIPVYDLYSEEFLDSHDEDVLNQFMYDGVHPNAKGYYILAEHIAGKLIEMETQNED